MYLPCRTSQPPGPEGKTGRQRIHQRPQIHHQMTQMTQKIRQKIPKKIPKKIAPA